MKGNVLVTGGVGYIGSHTVKVLLKNGYEVTVLDNLSTGHRQAIENLDVHFYEGDIGDKNVVGQILERHQIESVIHFAAKSLVGESVKYPEIYFQDNTSKSIHLFSNLIKGGVKQIIFSSSASVYGKPRELPIKETSELDPLSPYGETKLMLEKVLQWLEKAHGLQWAALRYFNAAGADPSGQIGEHHEMETHLIPLVLKAALEQSECRIHGTDYNTADGTCIRDYVHVMDLAQAHVSAMEALKKGMSSQAMNIGSGVGYSVRQIIETAKQVTKRDFKVIEGDRRPGDPDVLVADVTKAAAELNWKSQYDLQDMIETAWKWHSEHPNGYIE